MASLMMPMLSFVAGLFVWGAELATRIVMFQFANAAKVFSPVVLVLRMVAAPIVFQLRLLQLSVRMMWSLSKHMASSIMQGCVAVFNLVRACWWCVGVALQTALPLVYWSSCMHVYGLFLVLRCLGCTPPSMEEATQFLSLLIFTKTTATNKEQACKHDEPRQTVKVVVRRNRSSSSCSNNGSTSKKDVTTDSSTTTTDSGFAIVVSRTTSAPPTPTGSRMPSQTSLFSLSASTSPATSRRTSGANSTSSNGSSSNNTSGGGSSDKMLPMIQQSSSTSSTLMTCCSIELVELNAAISDTVGSSDGSSNGGSGCGGDDNEALVVVGRAALAVAAGFDGTGRYIVPYSPGAAAVAAAAQSAACAAVWRNVLSMVVPA